MSITGSIGGPTGSIILSGIDASLVPYIARVLADWNGGQNPGNADDALDQLAARQTTSSSGLAAHEADTTDPHGSAQTVSVKVLTPKIESTGAVLNIDVPDTGTSNLAVVNTGGGGSCNVNVIGDISSTGTVNSRNVQADGTTLDNHVADTTDPHGATQTVSTKVITPEIETTGTTLTLDVIDAGTSTLTVDNSGAGVCDISASGEIRSGNTKSIIAGSFGNEIKLDPAAGTITPSGTASPLTIANLNLAIKGKPASGSYTTGVFGGVNTSGATFNANRMYATPLVLPWEITISRLCIAVTTAIAGALGRMGIYDSDGADGGPGTLLADTGEINPTAVAAMEATLSPNLTIGPGVYWRVWYCNNASVGVIREIIYTGAVPNWLISGNQWTARTASQTFRTYAALPSSYGTHDWGFTNNTPLVIAKVA